MLDIDLLQCFRRWKLLLASSIAEHFFNQSVENNSIESKNIFNMKISQAVLLLASSSSAEKVDVDITRELYLTPTEDGLRTGNLNLLITQST